MAKPFTLFRTWKGFKATPDQDVNPGALGQAVAEPRDPGSAGFLMGSPQLDGLRLKNPSKNMVII